MLGAKFGSEITLRDSCALGRGFPNHIELCKGFPLENIRGTDSVRKFFAQISCMNPLH